MPGEIYIITEDRLEKIINGECPINVKKCSAFSDCVECWKAALDEQGLPDLEDYPPYIGGVGIYEEGFIKELHYIDKNGKWQKKDYGEE